jgi:hypothetical protein
VGGKPVNPASKNSKAGGAVFDKESPELAKARLIAADKAFCEQMRQAIREKLENPSIGIDHKPGTKHPLYVPPRAVPFSLNNSPGALCAKV